MDQQAWIDQVDAEITARIRDVGWYITYVGGAQCSRPGCDSEPDDRPPFAYTIGLFGLNHPELLMVGIPPKVASVVLATLGRRIRAGESLMPGSLITVDAWPRRIIPEEVPNPGEIVLWSNDFYQRPPEHSVPVLQLTYDDAEGRFPWDEGYATPELQPRPGGFAA
jgi:hypothetical protein